MIYSPYYKDLVGSSKSSEMWTYEDFRDLKSPKSTSSKSECLPPNFRSVAAPLILILLSAKSTVPSCNAYRASESLSSKVNFLSDPWAPVILKPAANPPFSVFKVVRLVSPLVSTSSYTYTLLNNNPSIDFSAFSANLPSPLLKA